MKRLIVIAAFVALLALVVFAGCSKSAPAPQSQAPAAPDLTPRVQALELKVGDIDGTKWDGKDYSLAEVQPKFAVTMREYGDRYADYYFAAKGGNWAMAAYLDHYLRASLKPTKVTKPKDQEKIANFNEKYLDPLLATVGKKDFQAFEAQYEKTLAACNDCHKTMKYGFVVVGKPKAPADPHANYELKTEPTDYADFKAPKQ